MEPSTFYMPWRGGQLGCTKSKVTEKPSHPSLNNEGDWLAQINEKSRGRPSFRCGLVQTSAIFLLRLDFSEQFKVTSKTERKVQRFPVYSCPHKCMASPVINLPHQSGHLLPSVNLHRNHLKSLICIRITQCCTFYGFDKYVMTYFCQYGIIQGSFTALEMLYAHLFILFQPPNPGNCWSFQSP